MANNNSQDYLKRILGEANKTYADMPDKVMLMARELVKVMSEHAIRKLPQTGTGTDIYDTRAYRYGDDPKRINAKLSARHRRPWIVEHQAEIRQHVFLWRKGHGTMTIPYDKNPDRFTKKEYAEVVLLATSMVLAGSEDKVGVLDGQGIYRNGAAQHIAQQFMNVNILSGDTPVIQRYLPTGSNVILISDFCVNYDNMKAEKEKIEQDLKALSGRGIQGAICMLLDPEDVDFPYQGNVRFNGQDQNRHEFEKAESLRQEFQSKMHDHIDWVKRVARGSGYDFMPQIIDQKPINLLLRLFAVPVTAPAPELHL